MLGAISEYLILDGGICHNLPFPRAARHSCSLGRDHDVLHHLLVRSLRGPQLRGWWRRRRSGRRRFGPGQLPLLPTLPGSPSGRAEPGSVRHGRSSLRLPQRGSAQVRRQNAPGRRRGSLRAEKRWVHLGQGEEATQPLGLAFAQQNSLKKCL